MLTKKQEDLKRNLFYIAPFLHDCALISVSKDAKRILDEATDEDIVAALHDTHKTLEDLPDGYYGDNKPRFSCLQMSIVIRGDIEHFNYINIQHMENLDTILQGIKGRKEVLRKVIFGYNKGEFTLLHHAIYWNNKEAFEIILKIIQEDKELFKEIITTKLFPRFLYFYNPLELCIEYYNRCDNFFKLDEKGKEKRKNFIKNWNIKSSWDETKIEDFNTAKEFTNRILHVAIDNGSIEDVLTSCHIEKKLACELSKSKDDCLIIKVLQKYEKAMDKGRSYGMIGAFGGGILGILLFAWISVPVITALEKERNYGMIAALIIPSSLLLILMIASSALAFSVVIGYLAYKYNQPSSKVFEPNTEQRTSSQELLASTT